MVFLAFVLLVAQEPPRAAELVERLRSENIEEREEAAKKLQALGRAAVPQLEKAARDSDGELALRAREILRRGAILERVPRGFDKAFPGLRERLLGGDDHDWTLAFREVFEDRASPAARETWSTGSIAEVLAFLAPAALRGARNAEERIEVLSTVSAFRIRGAGVVLAEFLRDPEVGALAAEAIVETDAKEAGPSLQRLLQAPEAAVRRTAVYTLGKLEARDAVPSMIALARDPDPSVREACAWALSAFGNKEAVPLLVPLLADPREAARTCAVRRLAELGARDAIPNISPLLKDAEAGVRVAAAQSLALLAGKDAAPLLASLLGDPASPVRRAGADALAALGVAEPLLAALKGGDTGGRNFVLEILHDRPLPEAKARLVELLSDPSAETRPLAAAALCAIGSREGAETLLREGESLFSLNALRRPKLWEKLSSPAPAFPVEPAFLRKSLEPLAEALRMKVEAPSPADGARTEDVFVPAGQRTLHQAFRTVLWPHAGRWEVLLEDDCVRVVSREEAVRFWTDWLKERQ